MAIFLFLIFHLMILPTYQDSAPPKFLHVYKENDANLRKPVIIDNPGFVSDDQADGQLHRQKRDSSSALPKFANDNDNLKNIITKVSGNFYSHFIKSAFNLLIKVEVDKVRVRRCSN